MALNFANGIAGGLSGAATGSMFGAPGAIAGGLLGGAAGLFGGQRKKRKLKKLDTLDDRQKSLYGDYANAIQGQGPLAGLYNYNQQGAEDVFNRTVANPAYRQFQENIIPQITGQFRGGNLQNSTYAGQALSKAGRDVQESLDAQRAQAMYQGQRQSQVDKMNAIDRILNMQTFAYQRPEQEAPGLMDQLVGGLGQGAGKFLANKLSDKFSDTAGTTY